MLNEIESYFYYNKNNQNMFLLNLCNDYKIVTCKCLYFPNKDVKEQKLIYIFINLIHCLIHVILSKIFLISAV